MAYASKYTVSIVVSLPPTTLVKRTGKETGTAITEPSPAAAEWGMSAVNKARVSNADKRIFRECQTNRVNGIIERKKDKAKYAFIRTEDRATVETDPSAARSSAGGESGVTGVAFVSPPGKQKR
jgi:hypothetical protein